MKNLTLIFIVIAPIFVFGQSETIQKLHEKHENAFTMFFYKSTLNMIAEDRKELQELVRGIKKMKLLRVNKEESTFSKSNFKQLVKDYQLEGFEELIAIKHRDKTMNAYIKESRGITKGLAILLNETSNLTVLDIKGSVSIDKIGDLTQYISELTDYKLNFD